MTEIELIQEHNANAEAPPCSATDYNRRMTTSTAAPTFEFVRNAAMRIAPHAHRTPVMTSTTLDRMAGRELFFKCENFQKVGAFKFRGACNAILQLPEDVAARGVVTHSSGNHAQALALAASKRSIAAHIVMPRNAPKVKRDAVACYGGTIYLCEPTLKSRLGMTAEVLKRTGAEFIPPYDHPDIIAGQGTLAMELLEQAPCLDAIIAPIGGGGMVSGICIAAHGLDSNVRVIAAEPTGADDVARSFAEGRLVELSSTNTIADGLLTNMGELTWSIVREHVDRVITVSDDEIIHAMRLVFEHMKLVIEPSAAVSLAAVLSDSFAAVDRATRIGVVLSGGNIDLDHLPWGAKT